MENIPRLLKVFVVAAGVALIAGSALLVVLIVTRDGDDRVVQPLPGEIALPPGGRIEHVVADGRRLLLLGVDPSGQQFLVVVDPQTGERSSLLWLRPEE